MLDIFATRLAACLSDDSDEQEVCAYGIEILISNGLLFLSIFAISIMLNQFLISLYFTALFAVLRIFLSGFHCKKYINCYLLSLTIYLIFIFSFLAPWQNTKHFNVALIITIVFTGILFILYCLNNNCNNNGKICFSIYLLWSITLAAFGESSAAYPILYCMIATIALLYIKKKDRRQME